MATRAKADHQENKDNAVRSHTERQSSFAVSQPNSPGLAGWLLRLQRTLGNRQVQRKLAFGRQADGEARVAPTVEETIESTRGGGQPLDSQVRARMEQAFGFDFGGVRTHTDATAHELNRSVSARAFTTGQDIFFGEGTYDPVSSSGRELLAHELTHVVQQSSPQVQRKLTVGDPDDQYEQEADRVAAEIVNLPELPAVGGTANAGQAGSAPIQRACSACEEDLRGQAGRLEEEANQTSRGPAGPGIVSRFLGCGCAGRHASNSIIARKPVGLSFSVSRMQRSVIQRQPTVRNGSTGCPVPELQDSLNATGETLVVDGVFGPVTNAAVRRFQTAHRPLVTDGIVGPRTWPALHTAAPGNHGLPAGEDTISNGWGTGTFETTHAWRQQLTPTTTDFSNCEVTEADGGSGSDTCWFPGSSFGPALAVTGGTWTVGANNFWGDDFVGWFPAAINFYRSNGRAPCRASFIQSMRVVRPSGNVQYIRHQHVWGMGTTTVSSTRDGQTESKTWP